MNIQSKYANQCVQCPVVIANWMGAPTPTHMHKHRSIDLSCFAPMSILRELGYSALHLYRILGSWSYQLSILFTHRFLYRFLSPHTKAYLDHEYKIVTRNRRIYPFFFRLRQLYSLLTQPAPPTPSGGSAFPLLIRLRGQRNDTLCRFPPHNILRAPSSHILAYKCLSGRRNSRFLASWNNRRLQTRSFPLWR